MGKRLAEMFNEASRLGGLKARIRLATLAKMTSPQAESASDTPEAIAGLEAAMKQLRKEWTGAAASRPAMGASLEHQRLRDQAFATLRESLNAPSLSLAAALQKITETATKVLEVERASVWLYDDKRTAIKCLDLFSRKTNDHTQGMELFARDFKPYFEALEHERTIAANDAHTDPRTSAFSAPYLSPLGINSMLDVPIWQRGRMQGVLCHEHTGPARTWKPEEEDFAYMLAGLAALMLDRAK